MPVKYSVFSSRRPVSMIIIIVSLIVVLGLVILSPFALNVLAHNRQNWAQLSNIGQTYGTISALLSSLALAGVIVSLLYQARDGRTAREQVTRTLHHELLRMEMDDPTLMTAVGAPWGYPIPAESTAIRQYLYVQMWVTFLLGNYAIGETDEAQVRYIAAHELFRSSTGRTYWNAVGEYVLGASKGRHNDFFQILDEEYKKVISSNVPISEPVKASKPWASARPVSTTRKEQGRRLAMIATAAGVGLLAGRFSRHNSGKQ